MTVPYVDGHNLDEDMRIRLAGDHIMTTEHTISVLVDDVPGKRERYIQKLTSWYPLIEVCEQGDGPVRHVVHFKARKKGH